MEEPVWYRYAKSISSGTIGGIGVVLVGHPFDTLKVRMQTQPYDKPIYSGLRDCFLKTIKWEGIPGLYKGVTSPLMGQMMFRSVLFSTLFESQRMLAGTERKGQRLTKQEYFISGGITGFVAAFIESPIDLFKSKMQIQIINEKTGNPTSVHYRNVFDCVRHIYRTYGFTAIFQGLPATIVRNVPANAVYFGSFEVLKELFTPPGSQVTDLPTWKFMIAAGTGGFLYWLTTYNADVVKSAMMSDESDKTKRRFKNIFHCAKHLYLTEGGYFRFWKGFLPCAMRAFPANATMLLLVEFTRKFFPSYN